MAETERRRVTASEREAIMRINLITALALEIEEGMQNRFKMIPGMKRDLRLIGALGTKMLRNGHADAVRLVVFNACYMKNNH